MIRVEARIANTGRRHGSDVIQVYSRRIGATGPARLVGFVRCDIAPADVTVAYLVIDPATLVERDTVQHTMRLVPGQYEIRVARHATDPGIVSTITIPA